MHLFGFNLNWFRLLQCGFGIRIWWQRVLAFKILGWHLAGMTSWDKKFKLNCQPEHLLECSSEISKSKVKYVTALVWLASENWFIIQQCCFGIRVWICWFGLQQFCFGIQVWIWWMRVVAFEIVLNWIMSFLVVNSYWTDCLGFNFKISNLLNCAFLNDLNDCNTSRRTMRISKSSIIWNTYPESDQLE